MPAQLDGFAESTRTVDALARVVREVLARSAPLAGRQALSCARNDHPARAGGQALYGSVFLLEQVEVSEALAAGRRLVAEAAALDHAGEAGRGTSVGEGAWRAEVAADNSPSIYRQLQEEAGLAGLADVDRVAGEAVERALTADTLQAVWVRTLLTMVAAMRVSPVGSVTEQLSRHAGLAYVRP